MNKLTQAFQEAACTESVPAGDSVTCNCGQSYKSTHSQPQFIGIITGLTFVKGCDCDASSSFGNMAWQHRHIFARFYRLMCQALAEDSAKLVDTLPPALGQPDWSGLRGRLHCGERVTCIDDNGSFLTIQGEGRIGRETCLRSAFTPDLHQI